LKKGEKPCRSRARGGPRARPAAILFDLDFAEIGKVAGIRYAIAATGAVLLYLSPHSPDLNPIEQLFAKLKRYKIVSRPGLDRYPRKQFMSDRKQGGAVCGAAC
jgi:transposase